MTAPLRFRRTTQTALLAAPRPIFASDVTVRTATTADAAAIHALIDAHVGDSRLLPRRLEEIAAHAERFVVAVAADRLIGCADLAPLSRSAGEVRSLVVHADARAIGVGRRLIDALQRRAAVMGFSAICAFTHAPRFFLGRGFSIVPHDWVPEKINTDCRSCGQFRHCGQYAVLLPLAAAPTALVPLVSLHG